MGEPSERKWWNRSVVNAVGAWIVVVFLFNSAGGSWRVFSWTVESGWQSGLIAISALLLFFVCIQQLVKNTQPEVKFVTEKETDEVYILTDQQEEALDKTKVRLNRVIMSDDKNVLTDDELERRQKRLTEARDFVKVVERYRTISEIEYEEL